MAHENPWFIITRNEILEIQEWLYHLESEMPKASLQQIGRIQCVLSEVRNRQP
jgi:hypothetical protein